MTDRRYRALLLGNSHFPDDPDNLPDLKGPINDVAGMGRLLSDARSSLFAPADIDVLTDRQSDQISGKLEDFLNAAARDDVLLIYYSGHGITANNGSLLLCARNTRTDRRLTTTVSAETIRRMIDQSAAAVTIIILDCCYAGAFKTGDVAAELGGRGRYVLAATRSGDRAADAENGTGYSRFTGHLLRGLQGAAAQPDAACVTVSDLYHYLRKRMAEDGPFIPQRRFDGDGDPILARIGPEAHHDLAVPAATGTRSQPATAVSEGPPRPQRRGLAADVSPRIPPPAAASTSAGPDPESASAWPDVTALCIGASSGILAFAQLQLARAIMASLTIALFLAAFLIYRHVRRPVARKVGAGVSCLLALASLALIQAFPTEPTAAPRSIATTIPTTPATAASPPATSTPSPTTSTGPAAAPTKGKTNARQERFAGEYTDVDGGAEHIPVMVSITWASNRTTFKGKSTYYSDKSCQKEIDGYLASQNSSDTFHVTETRSGPAPGDCYSPQTSVWKITGKTLEIVYYADGFSQTEVTRAALSRV
ncbi:caspase family protein [Mangrovihabitans endophyticus]|uniref:Peptidase C14 caspase domain-containing protein n=1 Tax=Mangrovihabitans endophyticus TaxID=1751298 RepID=A0A8J3C8Z5_9ACTN|nr:caspase family protein [Mangrovihabitans endophyticus]GGL21075.1 hypothetical protein GCM10012284_64680 [Mangrovihabitans endophyticus]